MDTESPGVLGRPDEPPLRPSAHQCALVRENVARMNVVSVGLKFLDENGNPVPSSSTHFYIEMDTRSSEYIRHVVKRGKQVKQHEKEGIDSNEFAPEFTTSAVVLSENATWTASPNRFAFGYLLMVLMGHLPAEKYIHVSAAHVLSAIYDIKCVMPQAVAKPTGVKTHHYATIDTQSPGLLGRPEERLLHPSACQCSLVRDNVNLINVISVGMTWS
ncbi:CCR4-NOT transcription complex subunit 7-like [Haemaphysalis longicornis]